DELRKLKGKVLANNEVTHHPSDPKINTEPITPKLLNKRSDHSVYIKHTQEEAAVLRDLVDHIQANYPLDPTLESTLLMPRVVKSRDEIFSRWGYCDNRGLSRLHNQSIERDRLIGIGFVLDFVEFISFTFGDKEMILVIEAVSR
ncbi:hypothetical protein Tco_1577388, partial [Tanacetum coccineum]